MPAEHGILEAAEQDRAQAARTHLREKWEGARSEDDRECVRAMITSTADSGVLDPEAEARLRAMCG